MVQFGDRLDWAFVMGGLARDFLTGLPRGVWGRDPELLAPMLPSDARALLAEQWLRVADETGAPLDPLLWAEGGLKGSHPACMAVKAATDQAADGGYSYLRRLREAIFCERRQLDHAEALVAEARAVSLDVERFRIDLRSHAITEAFGSDLEEAKALVAPSGENSVGPCSRGAGDVPLPSMVVRGDGGQERRVLGLQRYEAYAEAAVAVDGQAQAPGPPTVPELLGRFGRVTTAEVELICELPGPRAGAELYRLAEQWQVRSVRTLTGNLWQAEPG